MEAQSITHPDHIKVNIYPNPFKSRFSLEITSLKNENAIVCMLNHQDKIIKMFSWYLKIGTNKTSLDGLSTLPAGDYIVNIRSIDGEVICDVAVTKE